MEDYDRTMELVETAQNSAGKSEEQFAKYQDTIENKLNKLKVAWEELRQSFLKSDTFKNAIDGITKLVEKISSLDAKQLISIGLIGMTLGKSVITNFIKGIQQGTRQIQTEVNKLQLRIQNTLNKVTKKFKLNFNITPTYDETSINKFKTALQDAGVTTDNLKTKTTNMLITYAQMPSEIQEAINGLEREYLLGGDILQNALQTKVENGEITQEVADQITEYQKLANKIKEAGAAEAERAIRTGQNSDKLRDTADRAQQITNPLTSTISNAVSGAITTGLMMAISGSDFSTIWKSMLLSALPSIISFAAEKMITGLVTVLSGPVAIALVGAAIAGVLIYAWASAKDSLSDEEIWENQAAALKESAEAAKELADNLDSAAQEAENLVTSGKKLKKNFEELNKKQTLTTEEQETYNSLVEEIQEQYPEVVTYYNEVTGELQVQTSLWDRILEQQKESADISAKAAAVQGETSIQLNEADAKNDQIKNISSLIGLSATKIESKLSEQGTFIAEDFFDNEQIEENLEDIEIIKNTLSDILNDTESSNYQRNLDLDFFYDKLRGEYTLSGPEDENVVYKDFVNSGNFQGVRKLLSDQVANMGYSSLNDFFYQTDAEDLLKLLSSYTDLETTYSKIEGYNQEYIDALNEQHQARINNLKEEYELINANSSSLESLVYAAVQAREIESQEKNYADEVFDIVESDTKNENKIQLYANEYGTAGFTIKGPVEGLGYYNEQGEFIQLTENILNSALEELYGGDSSVKAAIDEIKEKYGDDNTDAAEAEILSNVLIYLSDFQDTDATEKAEKIGENREANKAYETLAEDTSEANLEKLNNILGTLGVEEDAIADILGSFEESLKSAQEDAKNYGLLTSQSQKWNTKQLSSYTTAVGNAIDSGVSEKSATEFYSLLAKNLETQGLDANAISNIFNNIAWQDLDLSTMTSLKDQFLSIVEESVGDTYDEEFWSDYFEKVVNEGKQDLAIEFNFNNETAVKSFKESMETIYDTAVQTAEDVQDAVEEQLENGNIKYSTYRDLAETLEEVNMSIEDYVDITEDGITLRTDDLQTGIEEQITSEDYLITTAKEQLTVERDKIQAQLDALIGLQNETDLQKDLLLIDNARLSVWKDLATLMGKDTSEITSTTTVEDFLSSLNGNDVSDYIDKLSEQVDYLDSLINDDDALWEALSEPERLAALKEIDNKFTDTRDSISDTSDEVEELTEKLEALNEALYGTDTYKNSLDYLYNYTTAINNLSDAASNAKDVLDNLDADTNIAEALSDYTTAARQESAYRQAENNVAKQGIQNIQEALTSGLQSKIDEINAMNPNYQLSSDTSDYVYYDDISKTWMANYEAINSAQFSDDFKKWIEEQIQQLQKYEDVQTENLEQEKKRADEIKKLQEDALKNTVAIEDEVISTLKEKYQEEIDNAKDKYDALADANDEYLDALEDAIQKERDLRDRQNQWDDLAQKEKKLSLLQRDTSGANQANILSLQDEIEDDRQQLLDDTVDDILETMKEKYEEQKEQNEQQLELMELSLNEESLTAEAVSIISNWKSSDDMIAWMMENSTETESWSDAKLEEQINSWTDLFTAKQLADEVLNTDLTSQIEASQNEIDSVQERVSETATNSGTSSLEQSTKDIVDAITKAQEAYDELLETDSTSTSSSKDYGLDSDDSMTKESLSSNLSRAEEFTWAYNTAKSDMERDEIDRQAHSEGFTLSNGDYVDSAKNKDTNTVVDSPSVQMGPFPLDNDVKQTLEKETKWNNMINGESTMSFRWCDPNSKLCIYGDTEEEVKKNVDWARENNYISNDEGTIESQVGHHKWSSLLGYLNRRTSYSSYKTGGLVDYTGPAWVDGTPQKPEAFLSAQDTERIGQAAQLLANLPILNSTSNASNAVSSNIGDTSIEIHINVENISDDYDVDQMIERVKQDIVDVSKPTGTSVILTK